MRARSIPEEHEEKVLRWYTEGDSCRTIADRLGDRHGVQTSPGSVGRLINRIKEGDCTDGAIRAVARIRSEALKLAERFLLHGQIANKMAGFDEPVHVPPGTTHRDLDFANRLTVRQLKVAGCVGRDADRIFDRQRELTERLCQEEEAEAEEAAREEAARTFAQPLPEPVRATSNDHFSSPPEAPVIALPKQGRNERCACGSGLKFKRCCGGPKVQPEREPEQALAS